MGEGPRRRRRRRRRPRARHVKPVPPFFPSSRCKPLSIPKAHLLPAREKMVRGPSLPLSLPLPSIHILFPRREGGREAGADKGGIFLKQQRDLFAFLDKAPLHRSLGRRRRRRREIRHPAKPVFAPPPPGFVDEGPSGLRIEEGKRRRD